MHCGRTLIWQFVYILVEARSGFLFLSSGELKGVGFLFRLMGINIFRFRVANMEVSFGLVFPNDIWFSCIWLRGGKGRPGWRRLIWILTFMRKVDFLGS